MQPGDLVNATLVVEPNDAYLTRVTKVGSAPIERRDAEAALPAGNKSLRPGDPVPDGEFIDQDGQKRSFSSFRGSPVVVTFTYTRCPVADFCPLIDQRFVQIQETARTDLALKTLRLVSISFDPMTDTPSVLKKHAQELHADAARWTFLTGRQDEIEFFGARFGVLISRAKDNPLDVTHTLRTAIVDARGRVVKVYVGNEWTPPQLLSDVKTLAHTS
jgi:protein SCO1/2